MHDLLFNSFSIMNGNNFERSVMMTELGELKTWVHFFSCMPIQVYGHVVHVHAANFVYVNYLCVHAYVQIVYATMYVIMYFT